MKKYLTITKAVIPSIMTVKTGNWITEIPDLFCDTITLVNKNEFKHNVFQSCFKGIYGNVSLIHDNSGSVIEGIYYNNALMYSFYNIKEQYKLKNNDVICPIDNHTYNYDRKNLQLLFTLREYLK